MVAFRSSKNQLAPNNAYFHNMVLQAAWPMALSLAVVQLVFIFAALLGIFGKSLPLEIILDAGVLVSALGIAIALRKEWIPPSWTNAVVSAIVLMAFSNAFFNVYLFDSYYVLRLVPYLIAATGVIFFSWKWLTASLIPIYGGVLYLLSNAPTDVHNLGVDYAVATALCVGIFLVRRNAHLRILDFMDREAQARAELEEALADSEKAFYEYTRTEERRRALEVQLLQAQKTEAIGVLAGGIAHGMNNLLGAISAYASVIRDEAEDDDPRLREIKEILSAAKRGGQLTRNLLGFARKGTFQKTVFSLNDRVKNIGDILGPSLSGKITIDTAPNPDTPLIYGDGTQLDQALMNICLNAADAMPDGGDIYLVTRRDVVTEDEGLESLDLTPGVYAAIRVSDTGEGMDEETLKQAMDPFFTTKPPDKGTGLGLAMVDGTVRAHGGRVIVESTLGRGTSVTMFFPAATDEQLQGGPVSEMPPPPEPVDEPRQILIVDDEPMIRSSGTRILERLGCAVLVASNGAEAIEVVKNSTERIDLIILDVAMPVMDGSECFYKLRTMDPSLAIVISTGFADEAHAEKLMNDGATGILPKPYDINQVSELLHGKTGKVILTEK